LTDHKKQEVLTASGYQFDRDLVKVPIKVSPALQAVIANQLDLIEMLEKGGPLDSVFISQHRVELSTLEDEIAGAFSKHVKKKEAEKVRRSVKKESGPEIPEWSPEESTAVKNAGMGKSGLEDNYSLVPDEEEQLDRMANSLSPGLPSSKYGQRPCPAEKPAAVDVRRVAVGASIMALSNFLGRDLTEEEIAAVEEQVEKYL
jgi:hypothetical protein